MRGSQPIYLGRDARGPVGVQQEAPPVQHHGRGQGQAIGGEARGSRSIPRRCCGGRRLLGRLRPKEERAACLIHYAQALELVLRVGVLLLLLLVHAVW